MDFVMVPVPEDIADRVLTYVSLKGQPRLKPSRTPVDETSRPSSPGGSGGVAERGPIAQVFDRLDDPSRRLVAVVATASLEHEEPTVPEAARRAGVTTREALGIIVELNYLIGTEGGPPLAVIVKEMEGADAIDATFTWDSRFVAMLEPVARSFAELVGIDVGQ